MRLWETQCIVSRPALEMRLAGDYQIYLDFQR